MATRKHVVLAGATLAAGAHPMSLQPTWWWHTRRPSGQRRVLVYGAGATGRRLIGAVQAQSGLDLQILGLFDDRVAAKADRLELAEVVGTSDDLLRWCQTRPVDEVIIALPREANARLRQLVHKLCALPASITLYDDSEQDGANGSSIRRRVLLQREHDRLYRRVKSTVDCVLAMVALVVTLPLMLAIGLLVKLESSGPVVFRQQRYGHKGRVFWLHKFRTLRHELADPSGARQTHPDDERVTRIGAILRRTHLDELPQLLNVLKGDMSLVGPRPHPIGMRTGSKLCHELLPYYFLRYRTKPGMTGWAQINGCRGATRTMFDLRQRVEHDLYYIEHRSLGFDLKILVLTLVALMRSQHALPRRPTAGRAVANGDCRVPQ